MGQLGPTFQGVVGREVVERRICRDMVAWLQMGGPPREMEHRCMIRHCRQHIYH